MGMEYADQQRERGKKAFMEGLDARENPYGPHTDAHYNWLQGFTRAERGTPDCKRCDDTGWLPEIEGRDGSYVSSRPCKCDAGDNASRLKPW